MKLFISTIILLVTCESCGQSFSSDDSNIYIFEYPGKIFGQTIIGFFVTHETFAKKVSYKINYSKGKITSIKKNLDNNNYKYLKKDDGNIYIEGLKLFCYESVNFKVKRLNPDTFYKFLSVRFLDMNNKDRQIVMEKFVK